MKHGVSGSWCPVGPAGGRGARGYGEFRRNTVLWDAAGLLLEPVLHGSLVTPLLLSRMAPVLGLPLCFCEHTSQRNSVIVRRGAKDLWQCGRRCVLARYKSSLPLTEFSESRF